MGACTGSRKSGLEVVKSGMNLCHSAFLYRDDLLSLQPLYSLRCVTASVQTARLNRVPSPNLFICRRGGVHLRPVHQGWAQDLKARDRHEMFVARES